MKAVAMKINKRTFVPPEEISLFQNFNLTRMLFFLNDSLLLQKEDGFYFAPDPRYKLQDNLAVNVETKETYPCFDFVIQFAIGKSLFTPFRTAALLFHYHYTHMEFNKNWEFDFYQKYQIPLPALEADTPKSGTVDMLKSQHDHKNNKYLIAHFTKLHKIDEFVLKDMIFRGFLVSDQHRNACFLIFDDLKTRETAKGVFKKSTKFKNNYNSYLAAENNAPFLYTFQKSEENHRFTHCHVFHNVLQMLTFITELKQKT
ncbi:hypothetical protein [Clostridium minihomine]|uniref:hypothetical protein n=1 Tax=Clostridium minihomine TaxID=2045012 RepID=UPI000C77DDBF|nr:hypothetical protein [Clostridium minihomine]